MSDPAAQPQVGLRSGQDGHAGRLHRVAERLRAVRGVAAACPSIRRSPPPLPTVTRNERERKGPSRSPAASTTPLNPLAARSRRPGTPRPAAPRRPASRTRLRRAGAALAASPSRGRSPRGRRAIALGGACARCARAAARLVVAGHAEHQQERQEAEDQQRDGDPRAWEGPCGACARGSLRLRVKAGTSSSSGSSKRALYSSTSRCGSSPRNSRVGAQERLHVGRAGQQAPLFVLERAQILGADLGRLLDRGDVDLVADARFAQQSSRCLPSHVRRGEAVSARRLVRARLR